MSNVSWLNFNDAAPQAGDVPSAPAWAERGRYDAQEVKQQLHQQLESVLGYLYPLGFADLKGRKFYIGDVFGTEGESLSVELDGPNKGMWYDFATGEGGDIFSLWRTARGLSSFLETVQDAGDYSGAAQQTPRRTPKRRNPKGGDAWGAPTITYNYTDASGRIIAQVDRFEWEDGGGRKKTFRPWDAVARQYRAPETRPLYNLPNIVRAPEIIIVEGEKAADALICQNIDATTAMGGANAPIEKTDWSILRGRKVVIWPDNDAAGRDYADRLKAHLEAEGALSVSILSVPASRPEKWDAADAEDEDLGALIRAMRAAPVAAASAITLERWDELEDVQVQWLIKDLIPQGALAALYGKPGSYKSFVALYIAAMVSSGANCFMRQCRQGPVVYVMGEGGAGAYRRAKAIEAFHDISSPEVYFLRSALNLRSNMNDATSLLTAIEQIGVQPAMIVIDTLARNFGGGNENSSEDMGAFIGVVGKIQEALGCAVLLVHHSGKDDAKGMRGHSSLFGAVDTELEVIKVSEENDPRRIGEMTLTKQKDGEDGIKFNYEMHLIEFGNDRTSLALEPIEGEFRKPSDLKPTSRQYLGYIEAYFCEPGAYQIFPPMAGMPAMRTAKLDAVRQWCRKSDGIEEGQESSQRSRWKRAIDDLKAAGKVGVWEDKLWLI